jgi:hypothetical protein
MPLEITVNNPCGLNIQSGVVTSILSQTEFANAVFGPTNIIFGEGITGIADGIFGTNPALSDVNNLKTIEFNNNITAIGSFTFVQC